MGIITNLIQLNREKKAKDEDTQLAAYKALLSTPDDQLEQTTGANPKETKKWAIDNIMQLSGAEGKGKGGSGGGKGKDGQMSPFKMVLHSLAGLNPSPAAPKPVGQRPAPMSDAQRQQYDAQTQQLAQAASLRQTQIKLQTEQQEHDQKMQQEDADFLHRNQLYGSEADALGQKYGITNEQKAEVATTGKFSSHNTAAGQPTEVQRLAFQAFADKAGKKVEELSAGEKIQAIREYQPKDETPTGNLKEQQEILRAEHPGWDDAKVKIEAAKIVDKRDAEKAKGVVINNITKSEKAAEIKQDIKPSDPTTTKYWSDYVRGNGKIDYGFLRSLGKKQIVDIMTAIAHTAAENGESAGDVLARQMDVRSKGNALTQMEKQYATVKTFTETAKANLNRAIAQAGRIVDSGSPFINKPWRQAEKELMGKPEYAAFHTARVVAFNEVSKVLSGSSGNGATSDSARDEANSLVGENATLAQLKEAAEILNQDMGTREEEMQKTITALKSGIANPQSIASSHSNGNGGGQNSGQNNPDILRTADGPNGATLGYSKSQKKWIPISSKQ